MDALRRTATTAGTLFLVTEVAAIGGKLLQRPALDPGYLDAGATGTVRAGSLLELVLAIACIGTAVVLHPVLRRGQPALALGYVAGRLLEAVAIVLGLTSVQAITSLREGAEATGAGEGHRVAAETLTAVHDWAFQVGPNLVLGLNSLLLAHLVLRARLVPRSIALLGLVGGSLVTASGALLVLGVVEMYSPVTFVLALPVLAWELSLAVHLVRRGFPEVPAVPETSGGAAPTGVPG